MRFGVVFLVVLAGAALVGLAQPRSESRDAAEPVARNRRLTALAGIVLYVLLLALAATVVDVRRLLIAHYLVGLLLIPPVILKLGSTGYRFLRYYSGSETFRLAGAPPLLLRFIIAPVLVLSTAAVFATGLELWLFGLQFGSVWISWHTLSAVVMLIAVAAHVLAHTRLSAGVFAEEVMARREAVLSPRSLVVASLVSGAVLAAASLLYVSPFTTSVAGG
jgi:hypothetical protein